MRACRKCSTSSALGVPLARTSLTWTCDILCAVGQAVVYLRPLLGIAVCLLVVREGRRLLKTFRGISAHQHFCLTGLGVREGRRLLLTLRGISVSCSVPWACSPMPWREHLPTTNMWPKRLMERGSRPGGEGRSLRDRAYCRSSVRGFSN